MSKVVGFVVGAALVVAGVLTGNPALIIQGTAMIVTQAVVNLTAPKTPARQASEMTIQLGEQPRSGQLGETFSAGSLVDAFNFGGKYGTDKEVLIIRLADHRCHSLTGFFVNDEWVDFATDVDPDGNVPNYDGKHYEHLHVFFRADTSVDTFPAEITDNWPGHSVLDVGQSGCDVAVMYRADTPTAKKPIWPGGRPRFGWVFKALLAYDPRLDSTVPGGSGTHRWDDPATREYSDNPAVLRYNWVRGIYANDQVLNPGALLVGRGLTAAEAPPENIFAAANLCDELVDGEKRYRVAGPIYANQEFLEVEEMFALATAGSVVTRQGSVELEPGAAKSVVATFTDDDIISGTGVSYNHRVLSESSGEWINTVVARYVEPDQKWNDHTAPVARDSGDVISDGKPREASITLRLVRYVTQAQRVAEIARRMGRLWGRANVTLGPRFCELEDGDWVTWTSARYGFSITFRIEAYSINEKWQNTLTLREISADVFDDTAIFHPDYSVATPTSPPPDVGSPDSGGWDLDPLTLDSGGVKTPALVFTGSTADDENASEITFELWKDDGVIDPLDPLTDLDTIPWVIVGTTDPTATRLEVTSIEGGATYYGAVSYLVDGYGSDRLVLGPVVAPAIDASEAIGKEIDKLSWKQAVRVATTANGTLASSFENGDTVDGVVLATGNRILIKDQTSGAENGIYVVNASGAPTRASDADTGVEMDCATVPVSEGTANADSTWVCTTNAPITLGTTALTFTTKSLAVKDEGATLTSNPSSINFTGAGVTATNSAGAVTVDIPGGGGGGGGWVLVGEYVADGLASSVSFTGIAATYRALKVIGSARTTNGGTGTNTLMMRFNNDTANNYGQQRLGANGGTVFGTLTTGAAQIMISEVPRDGNVANAPAVFEMEIPNYAGTAFWKFTTGKYGMVANTTTGQLYSFSQTGYWTGTAAINRVDFVLDAGNFKVGSRLQLYAIP